MCARFRKWFFLFDLPILDQAFFLLSEAPEQFSRRLVVGVLANQPPADSKVEDGLAELFDVLRAGGEAGEMAEVELGVLPERFGCAGASGLVEQSPVQHHPRAGRGPTPPRRSARHSSSSEEGSPVSLLFLFSRLPS